VIEQCSERGERWLTANASVGWEEIMIATCSRPSLAGMNLAALGRHMGRAPADAMLDLIRDEEAGVSMVLFSQSEENVAKALAHPHVMVGSDSLGLSAGPGPYPGKPHPRMYGTFPRVLGRYCREQRLFPLETAVHKMTGMPAARLALKDRGLLRPGYAADLALFDPDTVIDRATFEAPHQHPLGIPYVIVNGQVVVDGGKMHALPAGRVLLPV
jgi:N-acyl-D-aspartate/D-glutamate deacylase